MNREQAANELYESALAGCAAGNRWIASRQLHAARGYWPLDVEAVLILECMLYPDDGRKAAQLASVRRSRYGY